MFKYSLHYICTTIFYICISRFLKQVPRMVLFSIHQCIALMKTGENASHFVSLPKRTSKDSQGMRRVLKNISKNIFARSTHVSSLRYRTSIEHWRNFPPWNSQFRLLGTRTDELTRRTFSSI